MQASLDLGWVSRVTGARCSRWARWLDGRTWKDAVQPAVRMRLETWRRGTETAALWRWEAVAGAG